MKNSEGIGAKSAVVSQSTMKFASCDDDPGNSVNAYLWVGVQGVVAPEFIIRPNFLMPNSR
ncbi:hypothetical protein LEP1GSC170_2959 [Leptospira interrogans serovar Bataviae str. HAI135]|nr:hypothetical protein LEP1GSC170_2959 [Leptospira interrogans serovar Bataviae str. HAI135]